VKNGQIRYRKRFLKKSDLHKKKMTNWDASYAPTLPIKENDVEYSDSEEFWVSDYIHASQEYLIEQRKVSDEFVSNDSMDPASSNPEILNIPGSYVPPRIIWPEKEAVRFELLKNYGGAVFSRENNTFIAHFTEKGQEGPRIEVEFDMDELNPSDRLLIKEGVPLVWIIGYDNTKGYRQRKSVLYVRRVPQLSEDEIKENEEKLESTFSELFLSSY